MSKRKLSGVEWINSSEKRAMDLAYCTALAPILLPIGASALALSRIIDGQGALFSHERLGKKAKPLKVYKVRTLKGVESHEAGVGTYSPHATNLGKILRPFAIDENSAITQCI